KKVFEGILEALFFDLGHVIRDADGTFRLRKEEDKTFMTYKKKIPHDKIKIRDETEIEVSSFNEAKKLIESLGFKEIKNLKKKRVTYQLHDVKFEFDEYLSKHNFVPLFLEIEARTLDDIYKYIKLLGFSIKDCKHWSTKEIIEHYSA
ncbi:MAG: class IV adenylate cyclase, partial [Nanoarchaeota archaeon]|nr:class IV adenylate cyclase [Nanoarchaeota archaeon]